MPPKDHASWSDADKTLLLDFLRDHAAAAGDSDNFKMPTFTAAALLVEAKRTKGGPKTGKSCQNQYNGLRRTFRAIQDIMAHTGWDWDDNHGAGITPVMEPAWALFLKSSKDAKPFKNHGWVHLATMTLIMPATVRGTHVFWPSQGITGMGASGHNLNEPAEEEDEEDKEDDSGPDKENAPPAVPTTLSFPSATPIIPSTPSRASRKRERAVSNASQAAPSKKGRTTGANAIKGLTTSIDIFGHNMAKALAGDPSEKTPQPHRRAVKAAQGEKWLPAGDRLVLCNIFKQNIKAVDAYEALEPDNTEFCKIWIQDKIDERKKVNSAA
ncbi:hypothetical protein CPB83DRAFT_909648 [Crepidotus variabilis]|uniref:Myb/SANT-like domain-containing protein n=1 Tax=Crepidotus variabilis TaxID=179855 RepID=A0A9P6JL30_9AGAR|nr:hypothetical protein CPB83DRAFT_909648 [Crepidotus variabilis]